MYTPTHLETNPSRSHPYFDTDHTPYSASLYKVWFDKALSRTTNDDSH